MNIDSDNLFNWYETKQMKEFLQKDDYDYSATGIKPSSRTLITGATGTGKTQALLHYLRLSPNCFSKIMVFYKEVEPAYELLKKGIKETGRFFLIQASAGCSISSSISRVVATALARASRIARRAKTNMVSISTI